MFREIIIYGGIDRNQGRLVQGTRGLWIGSIPLMEDGCRVKIFNQMFG